MDIDYKKIMSSLKERMKTFGRKLVTDFNNTIKQVSIDGLGWTALIALQAVTVPSLLGLAAGITDNTPPIDMVIILWVAMALFYLKSIIERNIVALVILGLGFLGQSLLMALIFFK